MLRILPSLNFAENKLYMKNITVLLLLSNIGKNMKGLPNGPG